MADLSAIKKRLAPWFMERGLISSSNRRVWYDDNGFYATVIEIQPCKGMGIIVNVGVNFFWKRYSGVAYDYALGGIEVTVPNATFGALLFDSIKFESELEYVLSETEKRIEFYRKLKDISYLDELLKTRYDAISIMNKDFLKRDSSREITRALLGDFKTAKELFSNDVQNSVAALLLPIVEEKDKFRQAVFEIISECRSNFATKQRIKLKEVSIDI